MQNQERQREEYFNHPLLCHPQSPKYNLRKLLSKCLPGLCFCWANLVFVAVAFNQSSLEVSKVDSSLELYVWLHRETFQSFTLSCCIGLIINACCKKKKCCWWFVFKCCFLFLSSQCQSKAAVCVMPPCSTFYFSHISNSFWGVFLFFVFFLLHDFLKAVFTSKHFL